MRLFPILSAILVVLVLYGLIMERDTLLAVARGEAAPVELLQQDEDTAEPESAEPVVDVNDKTPDVKPVGVVTIMSEAQVIDSAVVIRGQTEAARSVELRAETTGTVISAPIRKGALVQEGDLLCELDPGTKQNTLDEAEARLAEAEANVPSAEARVEEALAVLAEARINQNASQKLSQGGFASETRVVSSEASVRSAEAAVAQARSGLSTAQAAIQSAEAAVASAERALTLTEIHAPFGGLLEADTAELGSLLQNGGLCATILQLDPIKLVGFVPETEVGRVKQGARAGARLAATGEQVVGTVTFLSRAADPQTRTFRVEIEVPNADLSISDGLTAEIGIESAGADAHLIPQSALTLNDDGKLGVRTVEDDNMAGFKPVRLLRDTPEGVWVTGLPKTAQVIVIGQEYVVAGVPVAPTVKETEQ
jgi:multidrug efflux system membrane fusion protein